MADCPDCGQSTQDCGCLDAGCSSYPDALCVIYNKTSTEDSGLVNLNLPNGTSLKVILEAIDDALGNSTTFNFSAYSLPYLRQTYTITDLQSFSESTDSALSHLKDLLDSLQATETSNYTNLNSTISDILYPNLYSTCGIGFTSSDTLSQALQKFVNHYCTKLGSLSASSVTVPDFDPSDTSSIAWTVGGTHGHSASALVKISSNSGNALQLKSDGLFVDEPDDQVAQVLSWDNANRKLSLSGNGGSVIIPTAASQTLNYNDVTHVLSISGGNSVDLSSLVSAISETQLRANNTYSISFSQSGDRGHTIEASVNIDGTQTNALSLNENGLFVAPSSEHTLEGVATNTANTTVEETTGGAGYEISTDVKVSTAANNQLSTDGSGLYVAPSSGTPLATTSSSTLNLVASGTNNHNLTGSVKISSTVDNSLEAKSDGLYVPPVGTTDSSPDLVANDSTTINFTTSGTKGHTLTGVVKLNDASNNPIKALSGGLGIDMEALAAALMTAIAGNETLTNQFCDLVSGCPCPCDNPQSVTVTYS